MSRVSVSIIIPTLRRPDDLYRCLRGVSGQTLAPDQIVVVHRADDSSVSGVLNALPMGQPIQRVVTHGVGQVAAIAAGLASSTSQIVALLDDDAVPEVDWLERVRTHYHDPTVGAVGGRDVVYHDGVPELGEARRVGWVMGYGRIVGNHHLGVGAARQVQHLKGVNMSFRRSLLRVPNGLRGSGAQVHNDLAMCLDVWARGWKVIYDPQCVVRHYPAVRYDEDARSGPSRVAIQDAAYNHSLVLGTFFPSQRPLMIAAGLLVGDRAVPGVLRAVYARVVGDRITGAKLVPSVQGEIRGWRDSFRQSLHMEGVDYSTPSSP